MTTFGSAPTPAEASTARGRTYPGLDGLRALAVLLVVMTHIGFQSGETYRGSTGALLARLDVGVTVFFLLSGFLLYGPFVRAHLADRPRPHVRAYLRNRALRVLPAYWVVVLVVVPVMSPDRLEAGELGKQLLLLQVYVPDSLLPGLTQTWSLSVEVAFYLALPLLAVLARRGPRPVRSQLLLCGALGLTAPLWALATRAAGWPDPSVAGLWLPAYLDWFALGMALAVLRAWHDRTGRARLLDHVADAGGTCWGIAFLLLWLSATPLAGPYGLEPATAGEALTKHLLYGAAATFLLVPVVFGSDARSVVRRGLEHPLSRWLGSVSYGVFLWHLLVLHLAFEVLGIERFTGSLPLLTLVVVPASVALAAVSLHLVEAPALAQKRRWTTAGR